MDTRHPFVHPHVGQYFREPLETGVALQSQEYDNGLRQFDNNVSVLLNDYRNDKIVIVSDHGIHLGEWGMVDQHHTLDKHILNIPLFINYFQRGFTDVLVAQEDLKDIIIDEHIKERKYMIAYERTKRETVAIINETEVKKFERMV
jgi:arylsulfatase A-like enzyme